MVPTIHSPNYFPVRGDWQVPIEYENRRYLSVAMDILCLECANLYRVSLKSETDQYNTFHNSLTDRARKIAVNLNLFKLFKELEETCASHFDLNRVEFKERYAYIQCAIRGEFNQTSLTKAFQNAVHDKMYDHFMNKVRVSDFQEIEDRSTGLLYNNETKTTISQKLIGTIFYSVIQGVFIHIVLNLLLLPRIIEAFYRKRSILETAKLLISDIAHACIQPFLIINKCAAAIIGVVGALAGNPYFGRACYAHAEKVDLLFVKRGWTLLSARHSLSAPCFQPTGRRDHKTGERVETTNFGHLFGSEKFSRTGW